MARTRTPSDLDVIVEITFQRQADPDAVKEFKQSLVDAPEAVRCIEVEGDCDFIAELALPNLTAFHDLVAEWIDTNRRLIGQYDVNFVSRYFYGQDPAENILWSQDRHGQRRIDLNRAECISAEGDYVRVRVDGDSVLIHATLQSIRDRLPSPPFVQIHRSTIVHGGFISRLAHQGRRWLVELNDGSLHPIAKGRNAEIMRLLQDSPRPLATRSANDGLLAGPVGQTDRITQASPLA